MKFCVSLLWIFLSMGVSAQNSDMEIKKDFVSMMDLVFKYFQRDLSLLPEISRTKMQSIVSAFQDDLKNPDSTKLTPLDYRPKDNRGIEKAAVFYIKSQSIEFHRDTWTHSQKNEKAIIAALELMGLSGVDRDRYEIVVNNIFPFPEDIKKLENIQQQLCFRAAEQAKTFFVNYFFIVTSCHGDGFTIPSGTTAEMRVRLMKSITLCRKECAYGNNDIVLSKGWCNPEVLKSAEKGSKNYHGNLCYSEGL